MRFTPRGGNALAVEARGQVHGEAFGLLGNSPKTKRCPYWHLKIPKYKKFWGPKDLGWHVPSVIVTRAKSNQRLRVITLQTEHWRAYVHCINGQMWPLRGDVWGNTQATREHSISSSSIFFCSDKQKKNSDSVREPWRWQRTHEALLPHKWHTATQDSLEHFSWFWRLYLNPLLISSQDCY